jgi:Tfp pilus assembly PilM family ATPase
MEAEMFGLAQALVSKDETRPVCLIDIGAQSTVCSLVEKQTLRYSHSFDRGANYLTEELLRRLPIDKEFASSIRENYGLKLISRVDLEVRKKINDLLRETLVPVFREIEVMLGDYRRQTNTEVTKLILSGGAGSIPEIKGQFADYFKKEIEIADPFKEIDYPPRLEEELKMIGPAYSVAVGMAERALAFGMPHKKK